jgi:glutamine synthetase
MKKFDIQAFLDHVEENGITKVRVAVCDLDGVLRGKYISVEKFLGAAEKGFGFCDVVFGWDSSDIAYDNAKVTGWHTGYPDSKAVIDVDTYRQLPWAGATPFFLADFDTQDSSLKNICPRTLLKKVAKRSEDMGFTPFFSQEFEWFNFSETPQSFAEKSHKDLTPLTPGMFGYSIVRASQNEEFFQSLFDELKAFGIPLEGLHTETGPGVLEAAITYDRILISADRSALFKTSVKEIADAFSIMPTFMAKITDTLPGCSGHIHQSLWDEEAKTNLFYDKNAENGISGLMKSYMAGQLYCLPYILPMLAPTINSYKRLVEGAWAPTTITWGLDNRTTALRALPVDSKACRLETRVPGSDVNPYLAMAACLAAGLYGIKNNLKLQDATVGNGYLDVSNGRLPADLWDATQNMKNSEVAKELFGEEFVAHFTATREWEWKQFAKVVTDWEFKRYFEVI